jgi:hypothetical protein
MAGEGGNIIRNISGKSYKEAEMITKDASKGALDFKSPKENTFYGKDGGKKFADYEEKKKEKTLLVKKIKGPIDPSTNKVVNIIEKGKAYNYEVIEFSRTPTKSELKNLKWAIQYDEGKMDDAPKVLGEEKISHFVSSEKQASKVRIYAYFEAPSKNVNVNVSIKGFKFPMLIIQGKHKKGKNDDNTAVASDLLYGDYPENEVGIKRLKKELYEEEFNKSLKAENKDWLKTKEETADLIAKNLSEVRIEKIKQFLKKDNDQLFSIFRDDMWYFASGDLKNVAQDMVDKVKANAGGEYSNTTLTHAVIAHEKSKAFIKGVQDTVKNYISSNKGEIDKLEITDDKNGILYQQLIKNKVDRPIFHDKISGLGITINDVWAYQVYITSYKRNGDNYEMNLEIIYWDHFGLDYPDIHKFGNDIFSAWFILQHFRSFKPLITKIDIVHKFTGKL